MFQIRLLRVCVCFVSFFGSLVLRGTSFVRLDHVAVNDRVCRVCRGEGGEGEVEQNRKNYDQCNSVAEQRGSENDKRSPKQNAEQAHEIAFESDQREDQRVLENFTDGKVECDLQQINVKSHEEIDQNECKGKIKADIIHHRSKIFGEEHVVIPQKEDHNKVQESEEKALFKVLFDCVKIIRPNENRLSAYHTAKYISRAHILPAKCDQ